MDIIPNLKKSYIAIIKNSVGSKIFQNFYVAENKHEKDVLRDGKFSCAFFVSSILKLFNLINSPHCTVNGTIKDLEKSGWQKVKVSKKMLPGTILLWEEKDNHFHLGFYLGQQKAISNSSENKFPIIHHWTFNNSRKIINAYSNKFLAN